MNLPLDTRILVVDDFESMRRIIRKILNDLGFRSVTLAEDGPGALSLLGRERFGLLVTDWSMPGMDGIDLVRAVRADPRMQGLRILMVTAEATREQVIRAIQAGVDEYLIKPFTPEALRIKVARVLVDPAER